MSLANASSSNRPRGFASGGALNINVTPPSITAANSSIPALTQDQINAYPTMGAAAPIAPVNTASQPFSNPVAQVPMSALSGGTGSNGIIAPVNAQGIPSGQPGAPRISTPSSLTMPNSYAPQTPIPAVSSQPVMAKGGAIRKFAAGGIPTSEALSPWYARAEERGMMHPEGLITSTGAGRTDVHNISVPSGSYIWPADVVSGLSEGNTLGGAAVIDRMMHSNPYGIQGGGRHGGAALPRAPAPFREPPDNFNLESRGGKTGDKQDGTVPIVIAGGEFLSYPQTIIKKFGSLKRGHSVLDATVRKIRTSAAKTMLKLPGPKK